MIIFSISIVFQETFISSGMGYCMVVTCLEKFDDTKEVIRSCKSMTDTQHNDQIQSVNLMLCLMICFPVMLNAMFSYYA